MTIEQAMVQLLKEKSFEYISTVELAKTAGISRSSFYTHYKDKYDLIERYQQGLFQKLETIFEEYYNDRQQAMSSTSWKANLFSLPFCRKMGQGKSKPF